MYGRKSLGSFIAQQQRWKKLIAAGQAVPNPVSSTPHLKEIRDFGSNPGELRMFSYLPPRLPANPPLVVVLHGCTQNAAAYDLGAGWSTLANRYGFALLLPEQQPSNNPHRCFNWFLAGDIERGHGEALSIRQMVARMVSDHAIDASRVFITGLSAGGAMTSVMLATYPEVFAGGAIVAGLPYGAASNVREALDTMSRCAPRPPRAWGDLVRSASSHRGPWPKVSVWHGGSDLTVIPANANEIVKQWANVHGLSSNPTLTETVDGYPRRIWRDASGDDLIESFAIPGMAHGTPLAVGDAHDRCGTAGAFLLEVGISSSYHIAKFWGLSGHPRAIVSGEPRPAKISVGAIQGRPANSRPVSHPNSIDAVISNALRAAGLLT